MPEPKTNMTRAELQSEALIIQSLLNAAMALQCGTQTHETMAVVEMAHDRARNLNHALDSLNMDEVVA